MRFLIFTSVLLALPLTASAATLSLQAVPERIGVGDTVQIRVLLMSATPTNAFSGILSYSSSALEPIATNDGGSIVNLWIIRPALPATAGSIPFAGITPGGFSGDNGVLFSVLFKAKTAGTAKFLLENIEVLRNDGTGGTEPTVLPPFVLSIGPRAFGGYAEPADDTPPEPFSVLLGTDPELFGGQKYLVFSAVDKGSGVNTYEIAETRIPVLLAPIFSFAPSWRKVESPAVLTDQNLTSTVYVKAVDRAGNERLSIYPPPRLLTEYETARLLAILIAIVLLGGFWWRRRRKHV